MAIMIQSFYYQPKKLRSAQTYISTIINIIFWICSFFYKLPWCSMFNGWWTTPWISIWCLNPLEKYFFQCNVICLIIWVHESGKIASDSNHKLYGSWFGNNSHAKLVFHRFVWNRHGCHAFICIVWTSMLCALFKHGCHMPICIV
jgi:hypothetical protein